MRTRTLATIGWLGALFFNAANAHALPVVPGSFGFGTDTRAAYACGSDPQILRVTNLADSGDGSLRAALEASGPRVVIFEVSGTIELGSDIVIKQPCITIAGQTAPSPGITVKGGGVWIFTHDALFQHFRVRPGDGGEVLAQTSGHDALLAYSYGDVAYNIVYDHMSASWAGGKNTNLATVGGPANITYWRSMISEALYYAKNVIVTPGQPSSLGMLITGTEAGISVIGNLFAHNSDRNAEVHEGCNVHFINNVVYDWGKDNTNYQWSTFTYAPLPGPWKLDVIGNHYVAGPPPSPFTPLIAIGTWSGDVGSQIYMDDNAIDDSMQAVTPYTNYMGFDPVVSAPPVPIDGFAILPSSQVQSFVLANAGARPADRDAVDARIVDDVTHHTGGVISSQDEVGGWPALAENHRALTPPENPHADDDGDGYTNLEEFLHQYAADVEGPGGENPPPAGGGSGGSGGGENPAGSGGKPASSGGGGSGAATPSGGSSGKSGAAPHDQPSASSDDGGCSTRGAPSSSGIGLSSVLLALFALRRRRSTLR